MRAVLLLLLFHFWGRAEQHRFEARVEGLKARGQPVRYEDLETPPVPDAENGAKALAEAIQMLVQRRGTEPFSFVHLSDLDPSMLDTMPAEEREGRRAYLRSLKPFFDLLADAGRRPRWQPEHAWTKGSTASPGIDWLQDATTYLRWKAALDPEDRGRAESAAEATLLAIDLGERCRFPFALGEITSHGMSSWHPATLLQAASGSEGIFATPHPGFDAATFRRLVDQRLKEATPAKGPSPASLAQERVWTVWAVEALRAGEKTPFDDFLPLKGLLLKSRFYRPLLYRDANRALDIFEDAIALADTSPEEALQVAERLKTKYTTKDPTCPLTDSALATARWSFERYGQCVAVQRLTRVAMALLEHHQRKGAWPESLEELGEMPLDPYSGKPFVYERLEDCYARVRAARRMLKEPKNEWEEWELLAAADLGWVFKD